MKIGVLVINFGEPESPTEEQVIPFLERIFMTNASLEGAQSEEARRARSHQLAVARAPGLMAEYEEIGGSPLNHQSRTQSQELEEELRRRGHDATCYAVFQFVDPLLEDGVRQAREDGVERLVALPIYPLCGKSTTVAALEVVDRAVRALEWPVELLEVGGWHMHPDYVPFHAEHVEAFCRDEGVDLRDPGTRVLFSIHGTPIRYLEGGNRYDRYVEETCNGIARELGLARYAMGYQNHTNRPIAWTEPAVENVVDRIEAERLVVVAPSFMHEQSETLAELDHDLRERVEARGMGFHRVPVPHDHPRFLNVLADLVEARLGEPVAAGGVELRRCICRGGGNARCTNGLRLDTVDVRPVRRADEVPVPG